MKTYDCLIVGAGIVGCCIASDLARSGYKVCLVDKASDVATGSTKANTGLIHAGFDAPEGSLKAKLNVEGNRMYPALCKRLGVPLKKTGAIVIGNDTGAVKKLYERGLKNGVKNLSILSRADILKILPNITENITTALLAKDAYIVSPYLVAICLAEEAILNGADVLLDFELKKVQKEGVFVVNNGEFAAKCIFNAAGAGYNDVAKILKSEQYPLEFRRGEYYVLDKKEIGLTPITVFPLPSKDSKGVVITPTVDGNILVGPTSYESTPSTETTADGLRSIREKANQMLSEVNLRSCIRNFAGVRNIVGHDFVIEKSRLVEGVFNLAGICSPGLTSAPAISKMAISAMGLKYAPSKDAKKIQPYYLFKDLSHEQKNELLSQNKGYGKLVCKCEGITEGDILFALSRPLKISSVDAIKRRVRAGMGRCQGGFCSLPVAEIIAKKRNLPLEMVTKENKNSKIFVTAIRGGQGE